MLYYVYKGEQEPWDRYGVTLKHFYNRLDKDLRQWRHWPEFVNGFSPEFFRQAEVKRAEMLEDAALLPVFFDNLLTIQTERRATETKWSLADLIDSPAKAKKRPAGKKKDPQPHKKSSVADDSAREQFEARLLDWFPELADLPKGSLAWERETQAPEK